MKYDSLTYFLTALGKLFRMRRIYPPGYGPVLQTAREATRRLAEWGHSVRITLLGDGAIVEDRRFETVPSALQPFFQALWQSGCDSVQIDRSTAEKDLLTWMDCVVSKERAPYRNSRILSGSMNLCRHAIVPAARSHSLFSKAVAGYLVFLPQVQEALSDLESKNPKGILRGREIVCAIAAQLVTGKELFEPIQEMRDFDDYTFIHALNVCVLSSALARVLGMPEEWIKVISLAALCHDLGKKQVPKEILNKRGPLDPAERSSIEQHPAYGAALLIDIPGVASEYSLMPVVAYEHHMRADHSGYPRRMASRESYKHHFASLLVAVADVYDALRTIRPYRQALTVAKASTILIQDALSGKLHREYVSAFLKLVGVLTPGRHVVLSDGTRGTIIEALKDRTLTPMIEDGEGQLYDLSDPLAPGLIEVGENVG